MGSLLTRSAYCRLSGDGGCACARGVWERATKKSSPSHDWLHPNAPCSIRRRLQAEIWFQVPSDKQRERSVMVSSGVSRVACHCDPRDFVDRPILADIIHFEDWEAAVSCYTIVLLLRCLRPNQIRPTNAYTYHGLILRPSDSSLPL